MLARQISFGARRRQLAQTVALGPHVLVTQISGGSASRTIELPASIHGYIETPVYAKVAGYLKTINVDKGDHVKAGEVIAMIESPETDKAGRGCPLFLLDSKRYRCTATRTSSNSRSFRNRRPTRRTPRCCRPRRPTSNNSPSRGTK